MTGKIFLTEEEAIKEANIIKTICPIISAGTDGKLELCHTNCVLFKKGCATEVVINGKHMGYSVLRNGNCILSTACEALIRLSKRVG